jgi:hypothetical protein
LKALPLRNFVQGLAGLGVLAEVIMFKEATCLVKEQGVHTEVVACMVLEESKRSSDDSGHKMIKSKRPSLMSRNLILKSAEVRYKS